MENPKYCKDCVKMINSKPLPTCGASRSPDMVTGGDKRTCFEERLDGTGRCGTMGNNFTKAGPKPKLKAKSA